ncbi:hypothetical protein VZT92_027918 [Zoarces viviparus]|uniref:Uncharacterized protein n=1 Tax=Zoarces viviparus TaxID=48416 RepID=A0AAW1DW35_ZOAVI
MTSSRCFSSTPPPPDLGLDPEDVTAAHDIITQESNGLIWNQFVELSSLNAPRGSEAEFPAVRRLVSMATIQSQDTNSGGPPQTLRTDSVHLYQLCS